MTMEGNVTQEVKTETTEQPKTPTAEEQLANAQKQLTELQTKLGQTEKGLKTAHQTLTEKDRLLKQQGDLNSRIGDIESSVQILAGLIAKGEVNPEQAQEAKNEFARVKQERVERERQTQIAAQQEEYGVKARAIYQRAQETFKNDEDAIADVVAHLNAGNADLAERKVAKAEKGVKPVEEKKPEVDEKKLREQIEKEILIKHGLLDTETGQPSGKTTTKEQAFARYAKGEINAEEARKLGVNFS